MGTKYHKRLLLAKHCLVFLTAALYDKGFDFWVLQQLRALKVGKRNPQNFIQAVTCYEL
jgi:hypothetical protein